jgi:Icc-related predicted phosphoesterase
LIRRKPLLTLFFATDIHGSDMCFRKFVAAKEAYRADHLIMGGDLTGKMVVSLVPDDGAFAVDFAGQRLRVGAGERSSIEQQIRNAGFYPAVLDPDEVRAYQDPDRRDQLFLRCMAESLRRWSDFAMAKGIAQGSILVAPGNDDPREIDGMIDELPAFRRVEGETVELTAGEVRYHLVSCGYSNRTPWRTPRELEEEELERYLRSLFVGLDPARTVLNAHVPPWNSGLDTGPDIDPHSTPDDVRQRTSLGAPLTRPVGSVAVRRVIEDLQPLVSLHGHIHESRGSAKIGRTLCLNPGSDYGEGVLRGALVRLGTGGLVNYQLTAG